MTKIQYKDYNQNDFLLFPPCIGDFVPENHPVRTVNAILDNLDISEIESTYKGGGTTSYHPRMLLKVIVYAYLTNIYSGRRMASLLEENVFFMWLSGMNRPDFRTINRFRSERLADGRFESIFHQVVELLHDEGLISLDVQYIDGTKIESVANKYTFVWKGSVEKNKEKLLAKVDGVLKEAEEALAEENAAEQPEEITKEDLQQRTDRILEKMDKEGVADRKLRKAVTKVKEESLPKLDEYDKHLEILGERNSYSKTDPDATFMHMKEDAMNNGQTKPGYNVQISTENQYIVNYDLYWRPTDYGTDRILEKMDKEGVADRKLRKAVTKVKEESLPKLDEYDKHLEILGERNSYSKTDPDATFMHMKEDAMNNGQTKPGYNVQISTENQYIVNYDLYWRPTDYGTLIPFLLSFRDKFGFHSSEIVADSGYGSEQNYEFMFANGMTPYVKYNMFHKEMKRKFLKNPFLQANMYYNEDQDYYVCPMGQHMEHTADRKTVSDLGYVSHTSVYSAADCSRCPLRGMCYTGRRDRRSMEVNHRANSYRSAAKALLTSERGLMHRSNRPIEPEACFGNIKFNHGFKRFRLRSTRKTKVEWGLVSLAHNLRKYVAYKAKSKHKQAQSMALVAEKPAMKSAV